MNRYFRSRPLHGLIVAMLVLPHAGCSDEPGEFSVTPASLEIAASDGEPSERDVVVQLKNLTRAPVEILDIQSSCVCAVARPLETPRLEPGQSLPLTLRVSLPDYGPAAAEVTIQTDLGIEPRRVVAIQLRGKDRPVPHLLRQTEMLELSGTVPGEPVEGIVFAEMIEKAGTLPMVTGLVASNGSATATLVAAPFEEPGPTEIVRRRYEFKVTARVPVSEAESFRLRVATREPLANEARVAFDSRVYLRRDDCIRITPAVLIIPLAESATVVERHVILSATDGTRFDVKPASSAVGYTVEIFRIQADDAGTRARAVIKFDVPLFGQQREVELQTTHPICRAVRIPVQLRME